MSASFDKAAATKVIGRMRSTDRVCVVPSEYFAPREMMSIVAVCDPDHQHAISLLHVQCTSGGTVHRDRAVDEGCRLVLGSDWPARVAPARARDAPQSCPMRSRLMERSAPRRRDTCAKSLQRLSKPERFSTSLR